MSGAHPDSRRPIGLSNGVPGVSNEVSNGLSYGQIVHPTPLPMGSPMADSKRSLGCPSGAVAPPGGQALARHRSFVEPPGGLLALPSGRAGGQRQESDGPFNGATCVPFEGSVTRPSSAMDGPSAGLRHSSGDTARVPHASPPPHRSCATRRASAQCVSLCPRARKVPWGVGLWRSESHVR